MTENSNIYDAVKDEIFSVEIDFRGKKLRYDLRDELSISDLEKDLSSQPGMFVFWSRMAKSTDTEYRRLVEIEYPFWLSIANVVGRTLLTMEGGKVTKEATDDTMRWVFSDKTKSNLGQRQEYLQKVLSTVSDAVLSSYIREVFGEGEKEFESWRDWQEKILEAKARRDLMSVVEKGFEQRKDMLQSFRALSSSDYAGASGVLFDRLKCKSKEIKSEGDARC